MSHPDPLSEGLKRMEAGDIPGAVRFFESAVQKEPENQLVSLWKRCGFTHMFHPVGEFQLWVFFVFLIIYFYFSNQRNQLP